MAVTYKDISLLTQKASVAGTEKIPVSETEFITPTQIAGKVPVDSTLSSSSPNAIQNKTVNEEFGKVAYLGSAEGEIDMEMPDYATEAYVDNAIAEALGEIETSLAALL